MGAVHPLVLVALLWLAQGALVHAVFGALHPAARLWLPPHLGLLLGLVLIVDVVALAMARASPALAAPALRTLLGVTHTGLLLVYASMFGGYRAWNSPLTLPMIVSYADEPAHVSDLLGVPIALVYLSVVGMAAGLSWVYGGTARRWIALPVATPSAESGESHRKAGGRRRTWLPASLLVAAVAALALRPVRVALAHEMVRVWMLGGAINGSAPATLLVWPRQTGLGPYLSSVDRATLRPRPLVLILVDALRLDQMHAYGHARANTPFLSSLVAEGRLRRLESRSICTTSYCGILGLLGSRHWAELVRPPVTLGEVLRGLGYQTHFVLSGDHTSFYNLRRMTASGATTYHDGTDGGGANSNDDRGAIERLRQIEFTDSTFVYLHLMSTHLISERLPAFQKWTPSDLSFYQNVANPDSQRTSNAYHNGILQTDFYLRRIFALLEQQGVLDRGLVVVTSDHGEHLGEGGRFGHGALPYDPVVRVPLLVSDPLAPPYPARALSSGVDVAPTFLHAIRAPVPAFWSGVPLQQDRARTALQVGSIEAGGLVADVRGSLYKYLRHRLDGREEVYRLDDDPAESRNLASSLPGLRDEMRRRLVRLDTL